MLQAASFIVKPQLTRFPAVFTAYPTKLYQDNNY